MGHLRYTSRRFWSRWLGGLALPLLWPVCSVYADANAPVADTAAPAIKTQPRLIVRVRQTNETQTTEPNNSLPATVPANIGPPLSLADCIAIALDKQPSIQAARDDLAAAMVGQKNNCNGKDRSFADILVKSLKYRRKQAELGRVAASVGVDLSEQETVYAVTRNYISVLFAREQREVAQRVVTRLSDSLSIGQRFLKQGVKELTQNAVDRNKVFLQLAQTRLVDADEGVRRAMGALREAMGYGPEFCFDVPPQRMPDMPESLSKDEVIALALSRRPEMTEAVVAAQVTCLEVKAQDAEHGIKKLTFAAAADIHAKSIPNGVADGEYRPGALGLEMPVYLIGRRPDRVEKACDFAARTGAVVDKTRILISLEAENEYYTWEGEKRKLANAREAADLGDKVAQDTLNDFNGGQNVTYRDVLESAIVAAQARAQYNEIRYRYLLALAAIERITAGGFHFGFENVLGLTKP